MSNDVVLKNRKQLPAFGVLTNIKFDHERLLDHCDRSGLLEYTKYTDVMLNKTEKFAGLVKSNQFCVDKFFVEKEAESLNGEKYRQLYLTEFDSSKSTGKIKSTDDNIFSRTKRLDPSRPEYTPEANELNYGIRNHLVTGIFEEILNSFQSKVTRVRLAYLSPNYSIRPHVDYDPSYICRYHIPIVTNNFCTMNTIEKINRIEKTHSTNFPADGRVYFLNTGMKHWAVNGSDTPRLHLIIDVHGQEELKNLIPYL